jgi:glycosyltransferase involved in cell wall biosynthesis
MRHDKHRIMNRRDFLRCRINVYYVARPSVVFFSWRALFCIWGACKRSMQNKPTAVGVQKQNPSTVRNTMQIAYSLSVILPAHNEEVAIAETVCSVRDAVSSWTDDFEIIVVNDGSQDQTRAIVEAIAVADQRIRLINHVVNQGYGAALVSGFEAITKDLVFFMDSDGQFDIHDLEQFFPLIERFDAVLGYRIDRQDTWMRKVNAWGWKMLVRMVFHLNVRDIDCAFKLYRSKFFHEHVLETRGAMINTEILYKFKRAGYTYTEVGVHHLPRHGGRATGAKPAVILRAFRELFIYARKWRREELIVR